MGGTGDERISLFAVVHELRKHPFHSFKVTDFLADALEAGIGHATDFYSPFKRPLEMRERVRRWSRAHDEVRRGPAQCLFQPLFDVVPRYRA